MTENPNKTDPTTEAEEQGGTVPTPTGDNPGGAAEEKSDEKIKAYESALRQLLGLKDIDSLDDLSSKVADYQSKADAALKLANERLITAAINSLSGYDTKLLAKVMDRDKISVDEKGEVVGIVEAAEAAAKEFPAVVVKTEKKETAPFHPVGSDSGDAVTGTTMNDYIRHAAGRK